MAQHPPRAAHPHGPGRRDLWDSFTSAVGNAFDGDKDATTSTKTTTSKDKTVVKTVLTTDAPSTYTGPLTTKTASTKPTAKTTPTTTATADKTTSTATAKSGKTATKTADTSTGLPTSIAATAAASTDTALAVDTTRTTSTSASVTSAAASATATASSSSAAGSTSAAAKAGIAIGVLAGVFFVFALVFFLFRRHRKQAEARRADDEKNGPFADSAAIGGAPKLSRLSLRPVTQIFSGGAVAAAAGGAAGARAAGAAAGSSYDPAFPNRRQSRGSNIAMQNQSPASVRPAQAGGGGSGSGSMWERPTTGNDSNNPFGDGAQRLNNNGFPSTNPQHLDSNGVSPVSPGGAFAAGAAGAAAGMLTRKASTRKDGPNALDLTLRAPNNNNSSNLGPVPPSPAGTEYSMHSIASGAPVDAASATGAAIAAAGGPAVSTVHRVQLDFKPTLEDELELRAGQLVRLLHEYDDGWALCIRLDRSKQGVVPRTCLSTRPVKPRPPPSGARPMTPQGGPPRPTMNNGQARPQSPYGRPAQGPQGPQDPQGPQGPLGGMPRSMSPAPASIGRPQSPAELPAGSPSTSSPASGSRPQSPGATSAPRYAPPGPSPMNRQMRPANSIGRKPVPGQAY